MENHSLKMVFGSKELKLLLREKTYETLVVGLAVDARSICVARL